MKCSFSSPNLNHHPLAGGSWQLGISRKGWISLGWQPHPAWSLKRFMKLCHSLPLSKYTTNTAALRADCQLCSQRKLIRGIFFFFVLFFLSQTGAGQAITGTLVGTVRDITGLVLVGAKVSLVNQETGIIVHRICNQEGNYFFSYLPAGKYQITVAYEGFRTAVSLDNQVEINQVTRADFRLAPGQISEMVEVRGDSAQLQSENTSVQNTLQQPVVRSLPNINHNPFYYATLQANVVSQTLFNDTQSMESFGIGIDGRRAFTAFSINGGQPFTNDVLVDGISVLGSAWNEATVLTNAEGIQEVRTIVNNFSAEYGRGQGIVALRTKSGANDYHGSVLYRMRNDALNANSFANNAIGIGRGPFGVNYLGGSFGGPIRKKKAFFFASYEGLLHTDSIDYLETVPTPAQKKGDFSQTFVNMNGTPSRIRLFDPFNAHKVGPDLYQRTEIPLADLRNLPRGPDPFAVKIINYYPDPNRPPTGNPLYNLENYYSHAERSFHRNTINARIDYRWGERQSFYMNGGITQGGIQRPGPWGKQNPFNISYDSGNNFGAPVISDFNPYVAIGDTIVINPNMIADLRLGVNRVNTLFTTKNNVFHNYSAVGIPQEVQAIMAMPGTALDFLPGGFDPLGIAASCHKEEKQTNFNLVGSLTKTFQNLTVKAGVDFRTYLSNYTDPEEGSVMIDPGWSAQAGNFAAEFVTAKGANPPGGYNQTPDVAGYPLADLLLGAGSLRIAAARNTPISLAQKYLGLYVQNDWKVNDRLILNLGLRWDWQPGPTERYNRISSFDPNIATPYDTVGGFVFAGTGGASRHLWETDFSNWGPRTGIAYRIGRNWVLRGGFGISYSPSNTGYYSTGSFYGSDSFSASIQGRPYGSTPAGVPVGRWNESTVNPIFYPQGADPTNPALYGGSQEAKFPHQGYLNGRAYQWNFVVEKSLGTRWLLSAGYTASKGDHLAVARMPLAHKTLLPSELLQSWQAQYHKTGLDQGEESVVNPYNPTGTIHFRNQLGNSTIPRWLEASQFPLLGSQLVQQTIGFSRYDALILQANHNFSHGFQWMTHFTWSKSDDFTQTELGSNLQYSNWLPSIDLSRPENDKKVSYTDVPFRFLTLFLYELPFGRKATESAALRGWKAWAGGWQISGTVVFQSGSPIPIYGANNGSLNGRPTRIPGIPIQVPRELQHWYDGKTTVVLPSGRAITPGANTFLKYNPGAFQGAYIPNPNQPGQFMEDRYWYGTAAMTFSDIRGVGRNNCDLALMRSIAISESKKLEFSILLTNALNHTQFKANNFDLNLGSTNLDPLAPGHLALGQGTNGSYGTHDMSTYDPRQIEIQVVFRF